MLTTTSRSWETVLVRGVIAALFGIAALIAPTTVAGALAWIFGAYALVDGTIALAAAFRLSTQDSRWWTLIFAGGAGVLMGLIALFMTGAALVAVVYVIASWAILTGVFEVIAAIELRRIIKSEIYLILSGAISVFLGVMLFAWPVSAVVVLTYLIGWYALIYGASVIGLSFRLRNHGAEPMSRLDGRFV